MVLLPVAALAAGTGLQRFFEGPAPSGDPLLRWLVWSAGAGLLGGLLLALVPGPRRAGWPVWGACAPFVFAGLTWALLEAVHPLREAVADRREAACRAEGRPVCTARDFRLRCAEAGRPLPGVAARARALLGEPARSLCGPTGCTLRFTYYGPLRPESGVSRAGLLCSVVADAQDRASRSSIGAGADPEQ